MIYVYTSKTYLHFSLSLHNKNAAFIENFLLKKLQSFMENFH